MDWILLGSLVGRKGKGEGGKGKGERGNHWFLFEISIRSLGLLLEIFP
jgi:hypothetical protein